MLMRLLALAPLALMLVAAPVHAQKAQPKPMTGAQIIAQVQKTYSELKTYSDTGTVITEVQLPGVATSTKETHTFVTKFQGPRAFKFDFRHDGGDHIVVWCPGDASFWTWWKSADTTQEYHLSASAPAASCRNDQSCCRAGASSAGAAASAQAASGPASVSSPPELDRTPEGEALAASSADFISRGRPAKPKAPIRRTRKSETTDLPAIALRRSASLSSVMPASLRHGFMASCADLARSAGRINCRCPAPAQLT